MLGPEWAISYLRVRSLVQGGPLGEFQNTLVLSLVPGTLSYNYSFTEVMGQELVVVIAVMAF